MATTTTTSATIFTEEMDNAVPRKSVVISLCSAFGSIESGSSAPSRHPHRKGTMTPLRDTLTAGRRARFFCRAAHEGAAAVRVLVGDYELWIEPHGSGLIPAPVDTFLGRGSHGVRTAGAPGATILVLPPVCAMRPPALPT